MRSSCCSRGLQWLYLQGQACHKSRCPRTCTVLFSNCLILRPLQPFALSGATHHMKQHHITKDLSVHNSSVMLNITVSCDVAPVICHWPVTTETWVLFQVGPCEICVDKVALTPSTSVFSSLLSHHQHVIFTFYLLLTCCV